MQKISLENIRFYANHGVFEEEKLIGGYFTLNLEVEADFNQAILTDDVSETVDYTKILQLVKIEMQQPSKLIEHLAGRVANKVKAEFAQVKKVRVKITKENPPIEGNIGAVSFYMEC